MILFSVLGTVGILVMIPAFSLLYLGRPDRASAVLSLEIVAVAAVDWSVVHTVTPHAWSTTLEGPVVAFAGLVGFVASIPVRRLSERRLTALVFTAVWSLLVFAPLATLVFFPENVGVGITVGLVDLGGGVLSGVAAGAAALGVLVLSPGAGRRSRALTSAPVETGLPLVAAATLLLLAGAVAGYVSLEGAVDPTISTRIVENTLVGGILAIIGWALTTVIRRTRPTVAGIGTGAAAGVIAVAAGAANLTPMWAGLIGLIAGLAASAFFGRMSRRGRVSSWILVGSHLIAGAIGLVALGIFSLGVGMIYTGSTAEIETQFLSSVVVGAWSGVVSFLLWLGLRRVR